MTYKSHQFFSPEQGGFVHEAYGIATSEMSRSVTVEDVVVRNKKNIPKPNEEIKTHKLDGVSYKVTTRSKIIELNRKHKREITTIIERQDRIPPEKICVDGEEYPFLGIGSSNVVYTKNKQQVYKEPYGNAKAGGGNPSRAARNSPERMCGLLNKLGISASLARRIDEDENVLGTGYISQYYEKDKTPPTEDQMISAVVDFFVQTEGYILCDAFVPGNLLLSNGEIKFPDVGDAFDFGVDKHGVPRDQVSYDAWYGEGNMREAYRIDLEKNRNDPKISRLVATIEALITLKENFSHLDLTESVEWLKDLRNDRLRNDLADVFGKNKKLSKQEIQTFEEEIIAAPKLGDTVVIGGTRIGSFVLGSSPPGLSPGPSYVASPASTSSGSFATLLRNSIFGSPSSRAEINVRLPQLEANPLTQLKKELEIELNKYIGLTLKKSLKNGETTPEKKRIVNFLISQITREDSTADLIKSGILQTIKENRNLEGVLHTAQELPPGFFNTRHSKKTTGRLSPILENCKKLVEDYLKANPKKSQSNDLLSVLTAANSSNEQTSNPAFGT